MSQVPRIHRKKQGRKIQRECQCSHQELYESKAVKLHECSGCGFLVALCFEMQPRGWQGEGAIGCIM